MVINTIGVTTVEISDEIFAAVFDLPMEGLTDLSEVPKYLVFDARSLFSESKEQVSIPCHKREMKIEYRLLSDILAKTIYVKAGSFDAVTRERFLLMTAITFDVKVNWSRLLFDILTDMVTPGSRKAKGYAIQICVLLKNVPGLDLGDSKAFPSPRMLTEKTMHRYVVINEKVGAEEVTGEPQVKKAPKKKAASKKRPADVVATEPVIKKKRATKRKSVLSEDTLEIMSVAPEVVPLQTIEPTPVEENILEEQREATSAVPVDEETSVAEQPADEETVVANINEPTVVTTAEEIRTTSADDVDDIIQQVLVETAQLEVTETDDEGFLADTFTGTDVGVQTESCQYDSFVEEPLEGTEQADDTYEEMEAEAVKQSADEAMSLEDIFLSIPVECKILSAECQIPSAGVEITKITLGKSIEIPGVNEGGWYKAGLPKIPETDKGKAPLQERDPVKGNPVEEQILLTLADIECLVKLREQDVEATKEAISHQLLDFRAQAQDNHNILTVQLGQLVDYINRGGNDKKGEDSSRGPQPPPDDQDRPGGSSGNRGSGESRGSQRRGQSSGNRRGGDLVVSRLCVT
ncbi:hypothetical protein F511_23777 [Dorcoceras hygrometricum]|uniref:Uncharacterized protein n=1 Tax=Dorcoceras hygrometricum TaxID=472368 RepID=A0A2Z7CXT9_9LAMI|nr:hypothetical protein F511_23777 [Dorcoceras hygrometricum]